MAPSCFFWKISWPARGLPKGQVVGGEVLGAERVIVDQERQDEVDPALDVRLTHPELYPRDAAMAS